MANFPGGQGALPGVYVDVETNSRGVSIPAASRTAVLLGEGSRTERLVSSAVGGGQDGLDSTYSTTAGRDGRHFKLSNFPVISNRTTLYRNGVALVGVEEAISSTPVSSLYDYRLDIETGKIELRGAALVDQGGKDYLASSANVGNGTISSLSLLDVNAPTETWTIRCTSVRRDGYGDPMDGYAKFIAQGSVSGILLDGYGNQIVWQSNGTVNENGILKFAIDDGGTVFREGDKFTVKVKGGALSRGESLTASYIAELDLNDPEFFTDMDDLVGKHGLPSLTNRLSLGAQLAFANSPPGVWTCQAAPAVPRRVSYLLEESASGNSEADDLTFALPLGVIPDANTGINFFVTDPLTKTETQIQPNKVEFYDSTITSSPNTFHFGAGFDFSYTVILDPNYQLLKQADDGVLVNVSGTTATLASANVTFTAADVGRFVKIASANSNSDNAGTHEITSVTNGVATLTRTDAGTFASNSSVEFELLDPTGNSARILFTDDLALSAGKSLRATIVDEKDAPFFDVAWQAAYEAIEVIETDIVVPLPSQTISAIFTAGNAHCQTMSNIRNRKERVLFIGAIQGLKPEHVTGVTQAAVEDIGVLEGIQGDDVTEILAGNNEDLTDYSVSSAYGNTFRVAYFYPDEIVVQVGADRVKVDGFFMAASAAGYLSAVPNVAIPLTNKTLAGFTILRDKLFKPSVLENLAAAGVCVVQPVAGGGNVLWGRTTTQSGFPEEEELSVIFIRDRLAKSMRAAFKGFIGIAETTTLQGTLMARAVGVLQSFIGSLITSFRDVRVMRDKIDPRQWSISFQAQPVYPVGFIYIRIGLGVI